MFILSLEGGSYFLIPERSRKVIKEMAFSHTSAHWLANTMDECSLLEGRKDFFKTYHIGTMALVAHQRSNAFGCYLEIIDYGDRGRRGLIVIPEGMEGRGWKSKSREIKHALSMLLANKVLVVAQGDGKADQDICRCCNGR